MKCIDLNLNLRLLTVIACGNLMQITAVVLLVILRVAKVRPLYFNCCHIALHHRRVSKKLARFEIASTEAIHLHRDLL